MSILLVTQLSNWGVSELIWRSSQQLLRRHERAGIHWQSSTNKQAGLLIGNMINF